MESIGDNNFKQILQGLLAAVSSLRDAAEKRRFIERASGHFNDYLRRVSVVWPRELEIAFEDLLDKHLSSERILYLSSLMYTITSRQRYLDGHDKDIVANRKSQSFGSLGFLKYEVSRSGPQTKDLKLGTVRAIVR